MNNVIDLARNLPPSNPDALHEGIARVAGAWPLHHGGVIEEAAVAWRLSGPAPAPVVAVLGGISAHRRVRPILEGDAGWWPDIVGPRASLDTEQYRVLSLDYLGGHGDSTQPGRLSVSTYDQAEALRHVLDTLRISALHAIVGASYGGMVALAFAERHPDRVSQLVVISAADRAHPMATAWRSVQRRIVDFGIEIGEPRRAVQLARALAMATYRSPEEFAARFTGAPHREGERCIFPVEEYLMARGADYALQHAPESFLSLSESIDLHRVDTARIFVPTSAIAVREDQLVPVTDMRAMVARLPNARLQEISSVYGHDAFLKEAEQLQPLFAAALRRGRS